MWQLGLDSPIVVPEAFPMIQSATALSPHDTLELQFLRLPVSIDATTAPQIFTELNAALNASVGLVLDFSATEQITTEGLKVFQAAYHWATERSAHFTCMGENEQVRAMLAPIRASH
jgi:anti-anti-sigma regulatory factor